jgi:hypothetical protein
MDLISLTRKLLSFNNTNPPGSEEGIARYVAELLEENGFTVKDILILFRLETETGAEILLPEKLVTVKCGDVARVT